MISFEVFIFYMNVRLLTFCFSILILFSCKEEKKVESVKKQINHETKKESLNGITEKIEVFQDDIRVNYKLVAVQDTIEWLSGLEKGDTLKTLLFVNRADKKYLLKLDSILIPDTIGPGLHLFCPFPKQLIAFQTVEKIVFISYESQTFAAYEKGKRVRWGPVSLGKESSQTPCGLFFSNWKSKKTTSSVNSSWVLEWYFNLDNLSGIAMHEYVLPGYAASHGCVRMFNEDAYWFYFWGDQWRLTNDGKIDIYGTPVFISDDYSFGIRRPWLALVQNPKIMNRSEDRLLSEIGENLPLILARQKERIDYLAIKKGQQLQDSSLVKPKEGFK